MKQCRMTAPEKTRLKFNILSALEKNKNKEEKKSFSISPYYGTPAYFFNFSWKSFVKMSTVSALAVILSLGGLTYASAGSKEN